MQDYKKLEVWQTAKILITQQYLIIEMQKRIYF